MDEIDGNLLKRNSGNNGLKCGSGFRRGVSVLYRGKYFGHNVQHRAAFWANKTVRMLDVGHVLLQDDPCSYGVWLTQSVDISLVEVHRFCLSFVETHLRYFISLLA